MTNQTGERLARSRCYRCDGEIMLAGFGEYGTYCPVCMYYINAERAYQHGLKLEREDDAD